MDLAIEIERITDGAVPAAYWTSVPKHSRARDFVGKSAGIFRMLRRSDMLAPSHLRAVLATSASLPLRSSVATPLAPTAPAAFRCVGISVQVRRNERSSGRNRRSNAVGIGVQVAAEYAPGFTGIGRPNHVAAEPSP